MTAAAEDITQVRRMAAETTLANYSDSDIAAVIERYAVIDSEGYFPDDDDWAETYDLNAAAADLWAEKAAAVAANFDFSADGASFSRSQEFDMATRMSAFYRSRRKMKAVRMIQSPHEGVPLDSDESN